MKEKILILGWILFLSIGIYIYSSNNIKYQYDYNWWLLKNVLAAVAPDSYQVNTWSKQWDNKISSITFSLSSDAVSSISVDTVIVPPPPRDSH